jgi:hypothetical protein
VLHSSNSNHDSVRTGCWIWNHINNKKIHLKKIQRDNIKKQYTRLWVFGGLKNFWIFF